MLRLDLRHPEGEVYGLPVSPGVVLGPAVKVRHIPSQKEYDALLIRMVLDEALVQVQGCEFTVRQGEWELIGNA